MCFRCEGQCPRCVYDEEVHKRKGGWRRKERISYSRIVVKLCSDCEEECDPPDWDWNNGWHLDDEDKADIRYIGTAGVYKVLVTAKETLTVNTINGDVNLAAGDELQLTYKPPVKPPVSYRPPV